MFLTFVAAGTTNPAFTCTSGGVPNFNLTGGNARTYQSGTGNAAPPATVVVGNLALSTRVLLAGVT